jgi:hypothetical protein
MRMKYDPVFPLFGEARILASGGKRRQKKPKRHDEELVVLVVQPLSGNGLQNFQRPFDQPLGARFLCLRLVFNPHDVMERVLAIKLEFIQP